MALLCHEAKGEEGDGRRDGEREQKGWIVSMAAKDGSWQPWDGHRAGTAWEARRLEVLSVLESLEGCFLHPWAHLWQRNRDREEEKYEKRQAETENDKGRQEQSFSSFPARESHAGKPTQAPWSDKKKSATQASGRKTQHWEGAANNPKRKAVVNKWLRIKKSQLTQKHSFIKCWKYKNYHSILKLGAKAWG